MLLGAIILFIIGAVIYLLARRGSIAGVHPYCVACGFNLFALPVERARCPECGADILREGAVRIGRRRPALPGMVVGSLIALAGIGLLVAAFANWWPTFDGSRFKPVGMLRREMDSPRDPVRAAACNELLRRENAATLSMSDNDAIADLVIKWQADPTRNWDPRWGDLVQAARRGRRLSDARWESYLRQAMRVTVRARARVGEDDPLPLSLACQMKTGWNDSWFLHSASLVPEMSVISAGVSKPLPAGAQSLTAAPVDEVWNFMWTRGQEAPGAKVVHIDAAVTLAAAGGTRVRVATSVDLPYEQLAGGASSVTLHMPTPAERSAMADALHWRLPIREDGLLHVGPHGALGQLWVSGPPVMAAFRVVLRQNNREWVVALCSVPPGDADQVSLDLSPTAPGEGPVAGHAELVCIPEASFASTTIDVMEIWGAELHKSVELAVP